MLVPTTAEQALGYDPNLTRPRRFQPPTAAVRRARAQTERQQLQSQEKSLLREQKIIDAGLATVRLQLAALPETA